MLLESHFFPTLMITILIYVGFSTVSFLISSSLVQSNIIKLRKYKYTKHICTFVLGILVGAFGFMFNTWNNYSLFVFLFIPIIFIFSFQLGMYFAIGSFCIISGAIGLIYATNHNINLMIMNFIFAFLSLVSAIGLSFINWKKSYIFIGALLTIYVILALIAIPLYDHVFNQFSNLISNISKQSYLHYIMMIVFSMLSNILLFTLIRVYLKFIASSKDIVEQGIRKGNFIFTNNVEKEINKFIIENNINTAIVFAISFSGTDELLTYKSASYVHKLIDHQIKQLLANLNQWQYLPYIYDNQYFVMIDISNFSNINIDASMKSNNQKSRLKTDFLYEFEKIIDKLKYQVKIEDNKINIKPIFDCLIYGVQSSDIKDINIVLSDQKNNPSNNQNVINLIDNDAIHNKYSNFNKSKTLENIRLFEPNEIQITLKIFKKQNNKKYYVSNAMILSKILLDKKDFYQLSNNEYVKDVIMCHISALSIKEFVHQKLNKPNNYLIIDYPYNIIADKTLNIDRLISTINSYNMPIKNIVLNIDAKQKQDKNIFNTNLKLLNKYNVRYMLQH